MRVRRQFQRVAPSPTRATLATDAEGALPLLIVVLALRALFAFVDALFVLVLAEPTILAIRGFVVAFHLIGRIGRIVVKDPKKYFLKGMSTIPQVGTCSHKNRRTYIRKRSGHTQQTIDQGVRRCGGVVTADGAV